MKHSISFLLACLSFVVISCVDDGNNDGNCDKAHETYDAVVDACMCRAPYFRVNGNCVASNSLAVGDEVEFGRYPQGIEDTSEYSSRVIWSPLTWQILEIKDDSVLLISKYVLEQYRYHNDVPAEGITWEKSNVRSYLNGLGAAHNDSGINHEGNGFIDNAFTAEERKWIKLVTNTNPDYDYDDFLGSSGSVPGGSDTEDRIFLLSSDEYDKYFPTIKSRIVSPTAYAIDSRTSERKDIYVCQITCSSDNDCSASNCNNTGENVSLCSNAQCTSYVWLRSPGLFPDKPVVIIGIAGMDVGGLVHYDYPGLRPALYVRLSSER